MGKKDMKPVIRASNGPMSCRTTWRSPQQEEDEAFAEYTRFALAWEAEMKELASRDPATLTEKQLDAVASFRIAHVVGKLIAKRLKPVDPSRVDNLPDHREAKALVRAGKMTDADLNHWAERIYKQLLLEH